MKFSMTASFWTYLWKILFISSLSTSYLYGQNDGHNGKDGQVSPNLCKGLSLENHQKLSQLIKERIFFHGTKRKNKNSIMKLGLLPRKLSPEGTFGASAAGFDRESCENNVFFSKCAITGIMYSGIALTQLAYRLEHGQDKNKSDEDPDKDIIPALIGIFSNEEQAKISFLSEKPKKELSGFYQYKGASEGIKSMKGIGPEQLFDIPIELASLRSIDELNSRKDVMEKLHLPNYIIQNLKEHLDLSDEVDQRSLTNCFFSKLLNIHVRDGYENSNSDGLVSYDSIKNQNDILFYYWKERAFVFSSGTNNDLISMAKKEILKKEKEAFLSESLLQKNPESENAHNVDHVLQLYGNLNNYLIQLRNSMQLTNKPMEKRAIEENIKNVIGELVERCSLKYWDVFLREIDQLSLRGKVEKFSTVKAIRKKITQIVMMDEFEEYVDSAKVSGCFYDN